MVESARLLRLIDKANRIARIAFDDDPAVRAHFGRHLLDRARKHRKKAAAAPPSLSEPETVPFTPAGSTGNES